MNRTSSSQPEKGVNQNGKAGGHPSIFSSTHTADGNHEPGLLSAFKKDMDTSKVYLAGREYFNEDGQMFVPTVVKKLKQQLSTDPTLRSEYPPSLGLKEFTQQATEAALGKKSQAIMENRVLGVQTAGFTGAIRLGAELLRHRCDTGDAWCGSVYLSSPCDDSLAGIFQGAGIQDIRQYYYWDEKQRGICLKKLLDNLGKAPEQSVVVLSASGHYPTGADLLHNQWAKVTQLMLRQRLFPFLLLPAQALCFGDLERDAWPVQHCASLGMELLCAQSFSHCFGLYDEAVGHLLCVLKQPSDLLAMRSRCEKIVSSLWAQPSGGGARVVATVLRNPAHLLEWHGEVKHTVERCKLIRELLRERLRLLGSPGCWDHLTQQSGMYCCMGLNGQQVGFLSNEKHVYLHPNGCLNVSAINSCNVDHVAECIHLALTASL
ncbi:putative aspartate aminotransferase, cytoplasmic 2 [Thalassophryne amazonica]|uniref:putative aspartate aminotransferase, cytoplasmic 2 n=1 Tax=Thalassophryne amazonica TaxID=390379 RepID=UPI0014725F56|nr:putative aspartate aminotransferase, cytoplasmic 2 [Thalassophryne amazonica]